MKRKPNDNNAIQIKRSIDICRLVPYENRRRQNDIPQFSTERAEQENESINPYMEDTDFNEKAFDMIGPNAPQDERKRVLCCFSGKIRKTQSKNLIIGLLTENSYIHT